ncbi:hypothetical protein DFQ01_12950 [Paenibacillus cellulosilyticus]|uniref:Uncharacterized protein n=1 Tax=Paenibacillus cellulosilyticus TaxID=375489 RepID=A0A2V2YLT5_9BACL|nr:hypothetical protein [Paenibacillus cellulosilyticus]PWV95214.1 hypothetical protein DFQ01_12950 [Paenibacillus cellulosilyticus]
MAQNNIQVPFGYEPPIDSRKGILVYYDTFEHVSDEELDQVVELMKGMSFKKLVLYPLHESTAKRMSKEPVRPYYKRLDFLHDWRRSIDAADVAIEGLEGKRKKYTPIDSALRHLTETYGKPLFLLLSPETASLFAGYESFEPWITRIRLLLTSGPSSSQMHPMLVKYAHRWNVVGEPVGETD